MTDKVTMEDIEKVVVNLLANRDGGVFYASLISQMRRIPMDNLPACAGVTVRNGRIELYYNPKMFAKETKNNKERIAVLEHECQHLVKNHLARRGGRDPQMWNIACDIAINQNIQNLPDWVCQWDSKSFRDFKMQPNQASEWYYEKLKQNSKSITITQNEDGSSDVEIKDKDGKSLGKFRVEAPGNHAKWEEGADSPDVIKEVIKQTVEKAVEQTERMSGKVPGELESDIAELRKPPIIPWHIMLKRWVATRIKSGSRYSWKKPNRRFGSTQKGRVPTRKLAIAIAFDTSGSISDEELETFLNEIKAIMECYKSKFLIMEIDMVLQKAYDLTPFAKVQTNIKGRGGTSFKPAFEYIAEKHKQIDLLIYFTDMCGDFPDKPPSYPTLWVATDNNYVEAPFGTVLPLQDHGWKKTQSIRKLKLRR